MNRKLRISKNLALQRISNYIFYNNFSVFCGRFATESISVYSGIHHEHFILIFKFLEFSMEIYNRQILLICRQQCNEIFCSRNVKLVGCNRKHVWTFQNIPYQCAFRRDYFNFLCAWEFDEGKHVNSHSFYFNPIFIIGHLQWFYYGTCIKPKNSFPEESQLNIKLHMQKLISNGHFRENLLLSIIIIDVCLFGG